MSSGWQREMALGIVDVLLGTYLYATKRVDHSHESDEIDFNVMIDS